MDIKNRALKTLKRNLKSSSENPKDTNTNVPEKATATTSEISENDKTQKNIENNNVKKDETNNQSNSDSKRKENS